MKKLTLSADGICTILEMLDESIKAANKSLTTTYTDLIKYEHYKYHIGRCRALLDILKAADMDVDLFNEHFDRYVERLEKCEQEVNGRIYNKLRDAMERFKLEG